jgi:hypothetical protein
VKVLSIMGKCGSVHSARLPSSTLEDP